MRISGNGDLNGAWLPKQISPNKPENVQQGQKQLPPPPAGIEAMPAVVQQKQAARILDLYQETRSSEARPQARPQGQPSYSAQQAIDSYQAHLQQDERQQLSHMLGVDEYV